jgi:hypothetical protein
MAGMHDRQAMDPSRNITVYGAYGHTGRFVVAELLRRGWSPILAGRDAGKLDALAAAYPMLPRRVASIDDPAALDRALAGAAAVLNCAGPFLDTARPVIEAALRARMHYLDVAAEQRAVLDAFEQHADAARDANVVVMPGMAFYGGLADLLATAAARDWSTVDAIDVAVALDSWHPTAGTRRTGERNHHRRLVVEGGTLRPIADPAPTREWTFPGEFGTQPMVALPLSETITISRHLRVRDLHSYMNQAPLQDLRNPATPAPVGSDARGRSPQRFMLDVVVRNGTDTRRAIASGRDIYAVTAPLAVEAMQRILDGRCVATGAIAAGEAFDARDFLAALAPEHLELALS